jgi:hypothetical protein
VPAADEPHKLSGSGGLPRLAFILNGQVDLLPRADTKTVKGGRLRTTVPVVPDAPIGHFSLRIFGGKAGYLANTRELCVHPPVTRISFTAHNGRTRNEVVKTKGACGKGKKGKKRS